MVRYPASSSARFMAAGTSFLRPLIEVSIGKKSSHKEKWGIFLDVIQAVWICTIAKVRGFAWVNKMSKLLDF